MKLRLLPAVAASLLLTAPLLHGAGLPPGMVGWWAGENSPNDATGTNPGTLVGGTSFGAGKVGQSFVLDGADDYVDIGPLTTLAGADGLTVMAWVRRAHGEFSVGGIVGQWNTGGAGGNRFLLYNSEGAEAGKGAFVVEFDGGGSAGVGGVAPLPVGEWVHVAAVWRGADGFVGLYKNGVLEASTMASAGKRLNTGGVVGAKLGEWGTVRGSAYKWPGDLDEVAIFNRALSVAEIQRVVGSGLLGLPPETANDVAEGSELLIQGSAAKGHLNYETDGFRNAGSVRLESINGGYISGLTLWGGYLTNDVTGVVTIDPGSGGPRFIRGGLLNAGTVNVNHEAEFGGPDGWFRNLGLWKIESGDTATLAGAGTRFEQADGVLQQNGGFVVDGTRFRFAGGEVKGGYVYVDGGTLELGTGVPGEGRFILTRSSARLTGEVGPQTEVWVRGDARGSHTLAKAESGFANRGTIRLESANGGYTSSIQVDGVLTNASTGRIVSNDGAGGGRQLVTELRNEGLLTLNYGLGLGRADVRHVNRGTIDITTGNALVLDAGAQTFRQEAGVLNIAGGFDASNIQFEFAGGDITGGAYLDNSRLVVEPGATGIGYFYLTRSGSRLAGSLQPGQTVHVRGDNRGGHTQITVEPGFVNRGEVKLESATGSYVSSLGHPTAVFHNAPGGLISLKEGSGGSRHFATELLNEGSVDVQTYTHLGRPNARHVNRGTVSLTPGVGLRLEEPGQTFRQEAGLIEGAGFDGVGLRFEFAGGEVRDAAYLDGSVLNLVPGAKGPASFIVTRSSSRVEGASHPGQTVWVRGDNRGSHTDVTFAPDFVNGGTLRLASATGGYTSSLHQESGEFRNAAGGRLLVEPGAGGGRSLGVGLFNEGEVVFGDGTAIGRAGATHVNRGTLTVTSNGSLTMDGGGQVFRQEAGVFSAGNNRFTGIHFDYRGGTITGNAYLENSRLTLASDGLLPAGFIVTGSGTRLEGELGTGQSLWIRGDNRGSHTEMTAAPDFANRGTIQLASASGGYHTGLVQPEGTLYNRPGGVLRVDPGTGGSRNLGVQLLNEGTLEINNSTGFGRAGAVQVNRGRVVVAVNQVLNLPAASQTFRQEGGELELPGSLNGTGVRFENLGGVVNGTVYLVGSELVFGPGAGAGGLFYLTRSDSRVFGRIPAGATFIARSDGNGGPSTVVAPEGLVNAGLFQFTTSGGGYNSVFETAGVLVNEASGVIQVPVGTGGGRVLRVVLENHGEFLVNYPVSLGRNGEAGNSDGVIRLTDFTTLTLEGPLHVTGGQVVGHGVITGSVINRGTVNPGSEADFGTLRFNGPFTQESAGTLELDLVNGASDAVVLNGPAQLDGVIRVRLRADTQPAAGLAVQVIVGRFTGEPRLELPPLPAGLRWAADFSNGLRLQMQEAPASEVAIRGAVTDSAGRPLGGLAVQAGSVGSPSPVFVSGLTDAAGQYRLPLPAGEWGVTVNGVRALGFEPPALVVATLGATDVAVNFTLGPSQTPRFPDLVIAEVNPPATALAGQTAEVVWVARNQGDAPARAPWRETVLLGRQPGGFGAQPLGTLEVTEDLAVGASVTRRLTVPLPAGQTGNHWFFVRTDATLQVDEGNREGNNLTGAVQPTSFQIGDLVVDRVEVPTEGRFGEEVTVTWVVRNAGGAPVPAPWVDGFILSRVGYEAWLVSIPALRGLAPGESYTNSARILIPLAGQNTSAVHQFRVGANFHSEQPEANHLNNYTTSAEFNVLAPAPADLAVTEVLVPAQAPVGVPVPVVWTVKNLGLTRAVAPWTERLRLATDAAGANPLDLVLLPVAEALEPGAEIRRTNHVILPATQLGERFLLVTTDVEDAVGETGPPENNTRATDTAFTVAAPNLVAAELSVPSSATLGSLFPVRWKVRNAGNAPLSAPWVDRLVLHTPAGPVTLLTKSAEDRVPLAVGAEYERIENVRLPLLGDVRPGAYAVSVIADAGDEIAEANEADNQRDTGNLPLTIEQPPLPDLAVTEVVFPANAVAGAEVEVSWTIRNRGAAPAAGSWVETLALSPDTQPGNDVILGAFTENLPLAPGAERSRTNVVRLPASLAGPYSVFLTADSDRIVVESDEANNTGTTLNRLNLPAKLTFELAAASVRETDRVLRGRLLRTGATDQPLTVTLTSSDTNRLRLPETVTFPAGAPVIDQDIAIFHDPLSDTDGLVNLSASANGFLPGTAAVLVQNVDLPALALVLESPNVAEGLTVAATVSRPSANANPLEVIVLTGLPELLGPTTVTIPAGARSVTFTLISLDDPQLDLDRTTEVRATAAGHVAGAATLQIVDNDQPGLAVKVEPGTFSEAGGSLAARVLVSRTNITGRPLLVQLRVDDDSEAVVVPSVLIRGGQATTETYLGAVNDRQADGPQTVKLRAYVTDTGGAQVLAEAAPATFTVTDDDGPALRLVPGSSLAREGRNPAFSVVVLRNSDTNQPLTVDLSVNDTTEAGVPATVVIPAGTDRATFPVTTLADGEIDGSQTVVLTASAAGHAPGTVPFTVTDAELPDLVVSEVTAPPSGVTRGLFEIGYRVMNQGFDQANGVILQRIVASRDPVLDDQDEVLNETPFNAAIPPGESFARTLTVFAPRGTGDWWLFVVTDAEEAVRETLENNNATPAPTPFRVEPSYTATVETDVTTAPAGTAVPLSGRAVKPDGTPAVGELVNIQIVLDGARRTLSALTGSGGNFTATFQPLATEAGSYTIGAAHPGVAEAPVQDRFNLLGLRITPNYARQTILPGQVARTEFELINVSALPLSGITAKSGAVTNLDVQVDAPAQLAPGASGRVIVSSSVPEPRDAAGRFVIAFTSAEGAAVDLTLDYVVELPQPRLVAVPGQLEQGMVRGRQTLVSFEVVNTGGGESGPLNLTLPEIPWLRAVTASPLPSLAPGARQTITLQLTPDDTVPLEIFEGRLAVHNPAAGVAVPFKFRHVSDAVGDVSVSVVDELTYYGAGAKLAGATVVLRDPYTSEARFSGVTGADGTVNFTSVPEAAYNLDVTAPKHDNYLQTVTVKPGTLNEFTAFLRTQLVRYNWKVEEIDIEERAKITLETTFETTVPVPVVTIEPNSIDLSAVTADEYQVELKITNHGLIAAQEVKLQAGDGSRWRVQMITDDLGVIPAKSSLTVPVIFRRLGTGEEGQGQVARQGIARAAGGSGCNQPRLGVDWRLICGPFGVQYWAPVPVIDVTLCPPPPGPAVRHPGYLIGPIPPPFGGGGGGGGISVGWGGRGFVTYQATNDCSCSKQGYVDKCAAAEGGFKGELKGFAEQLVNTAAQSLAYTRVLGVEVKLSGQGKLCTCCEEVNGQGVVGLKAEGSVTAQIEAKVFFGPSVRWKQEVSAGGLSEAEGEFFAGGGVEVGATGYATLKASTECFLKNPEICLEGGLSSKLFVGAKASGKISGKLASGQAVAAGVEGVIGIEGGFTSRVKTCRKNGQTTSSSTTCRDAIVAKGTLTFSAETPVNESGVGDVAGFLSGSVGVEKELFAADCPGEGGNAEPVILAVEEESEAQTVARWFGHSSPAQFAAAVAPGAAAGVAGLPDDANGPALSDALLAAWPAREPLPSVMKEVTFHQTSQAASAADWAKAAARAARAARPRRAAGQDGVCAQVRLQIEQEAVVTRKAIGATLELINESEDLELQDIGVTINIYDRAGNLANDRFIVLAPELTRLVPAEGDTESFIHGGMALKLAPATTGTARWVILPKDEAAPEDQEVYFVGGVLSYRAGDVPGTAELTPGRVSVYPNAKLDLKYFHQRDVFSDDPFTDEVEPSLPFTLGVMVHNKGRGLARNMHIISAQPKIVENVKGLLIDFSIIATEVAGKSLTPSLTAEFGDINPGDTAIGRWLLKSTLQGLFIDYQATLEHEDRFQQPGASVFNSVEIHELIHQVEAQGGFADGKPDFLVNDLKDDEDLPDTVHLSDATTAPVTVVRAASPDGEPNANDLEIVLTSPMPAGFAYLRVPDPANGKFRLAGVKRSDGRVLAVDVNAWVTDRTFLGMGKRPRYENILHLFDHDSTGSYTLTYARDERAPDLTAPTSRVASLPANSPAQIAVSWTGQDDAFGTGVGGFDLFVSVNGGPFQRWLTNTRATSALYPGAAGRTYAFYSRARDTAGNVEEAPLAPQATTFTTGNSAPTVDPIAPVTVEEGGTVNFTVAATDADIPADAITYSLANAPAGMTVDPSTGVVSWVTGEADGPGIYNVTVRATDNGSPSLTGEAVVAVIVRELNAPPVLEPVAGVLPAREGEVFSVSFTATDPDLPAQLLRFRLADGAPAGVTINSASGELRWIPAETEGGRTVTFDVVVSDSQSPELTASTSITVQVAEANSAPVLAPIADQVVWEGDLLSLQVLASDTDLPAQTLRFSQSGNEGLNTLLDAATGAFTWLPVEGEVPNTNRITVTVTDDAVPAAEASQSFRLIGRALKAGLNRPQRFANGDLSFRFKGTAGRRYVLEGSTDFESWTPIREFVADPAILTLTDQSSAAFPWRYFRAREVQ